MVAALGYARSALAERMPLWTGSKIVNEVPGGAETGGNNIVRYLYSIVCLFIMVLCLSTGAFADSIGVGLATFDSGTPTGDTFDIINLTGVNAFPPDFPITTPLTITITGLVANLQGGGTLNIAGSNFTVVDAEGDLNCTVSGDAGSGGCNFSAYSLLSATLTGTYSPTTGLAGLPPGSSSILSTFSTTITPDASCGTSGTLTAGCDAAVIFAKTPSPTSVPEPESLTLLGIGLFGLFAKYRIAGNAKLTASLCAIRTSEDQPDRRFREGSIA
jgi:hypothetical protein